jgi:hypothetical protein
MSEVTLKHHLAITGYYNFVALTSSVCGYFKKQVMKEY